MMWGNYHEPVRLIHRSFLNPTGVKMVALFGASAIVKTGNEEMARLLKATGVPAREKNFYCRSVCTGVAPMPVIWNRRRNMPEALKQKYKLIGTLLGCC